MNKEGEKRSVTVRIAGEEHSIRSTVDPEHTRRCAELVEERVQEVKAKAGLVESHRAVLLAALSIADRYLKTLDALDELERDASTRATHLVQRIEAELGPEEAGAETGP